MKPQTGPGLERISKLLAGRGLCSRREADEYIKRGWVLLNGKPVTQLGTKALATDDLKLTASASRAQDRTVTILLNKPVGYVSNEPEDGYSQASELLSPPHQDRSEGDRQFDARRLPGLAPAGRLDIDSRGLLIFTQDGRIARKLIGEHEPGPEKEYLVRVQGKLDGAGLARLRKGMVMDGKPLLDAKVEWVNADQLRFVLHEGRKRQIRRMCDAVHLKVMGLKRVRIGGVSLGGLPDGKWRFLRPWEKF